MPARAHTHTHTHTHRIREGQGEAIYAIGVEDDGRCSGIKEDDLLTSLETLRTMAGVCACVYACMHTCLCARVCVYPCLRLFLCVRARGLWRGRLADVASMADKIGCDMSLIRRQQARAGWCAEVLVRSHTCVHACLYTCNTHACICTCMHIHMHAYRCGDVQASVCVCAPLCVNVRIHTVRTYLCVHPGAGTCKRGRLHRSSRGDRGQR